MHLSVKYGLIVGFIGIILTTMSYALGAGFMATWWVGILTLIALIVMYVILSLRIRKDEGGYISFKDAFVKIFLMCLLAGMLNSLFTMLLFNVIDPGFSQKMQDALVEKTEAMMERMGAPSEKTEEVIEKMKESGNNYSVKSLAKAYLFASLFYAVFSLITAASIKKNKPLFEEPQTKV